MICLIPNKVVLFSIQVAPVFFALLPEDTTEEYLLPLIMNKTDVSPYI